MSPEVAARLEAEKEAKEESRAVEQPAEVTARGRAVVDAAQLLLFDGFDPDAELRTEMNAASLDVILDAHRCKVCGSRADAHGVDQQFTCLNFTP